MPKDNKLKYGLWEDGKRIEWFDENEIQSINAHRMDYLPYFTSEQSKQMVEPNANFNKPKTFEANLADIKRIIA